MYLLHTETFTLHYFSEPHIPEYVILSHTWDAIEVSFDDIRDDENIQNTAAFSKIRGCCVQARADGFEYAWIDSCCIQKSSSSELSEAINSMFLWYSKAQICYAYLSDVLAVKPPATGGIAAAFDEAVLRKSRWFTRGWTLQELLAPDFVTFYNRDWMEICTKRSLPDLLVSVTGISYEIMVGSSQVSDASIAERMSWASRRVTSRTEDTAYCLLGIFGVNIPPLYGEGNNAFLRLQQEILKSTNDETIFAWTLDTGDISSFQGGLLAYSPAAFRYSGNVRRAIFDEDRPPYQMTNKGLCLDLPLVLLNKDSEDYLKSGDPRIAILNCSRNGGDDRLAIFLQRLHGAQYVRVRPEAMPIWDGDMRLKPSRMQIYVQQPSTFPQAPRQAFCTLHLAVARIPESHTSFRIEVDPLRGLEGAERMGLDSQLFSHYMSTHEGENGVLVIKLRARADGPMYFAFRLYPFLVLLNFSEKPFGANITTDTYRFSPSITNQSELGHEALLASLKSCSFDRLSRASSRGDSMSLIFKTRAALSEQDGGQQFGVSVTMDSNGSLPFPDSKEMLPANQYQSVVVPERPKLAEHEERLIEARLERRLEAERESEAREEHEIQAFEERKNQAREQRILDTQHDTKLVNELVDSYIAQQTAVSDFKAKFTTRSANSKP
jgi:hypothetical protein